MHAPAPLAATPKRALVVLSHAMERAFEQPSGVDEPPGLVLGLFQRREFFDREAERYAALAAAGHTVIVAFQGSVDGLPAEVHAVTLDEGDPRATRWVLALVRGAYATALVATDSRDLATGELSLEASRLFNARWTFRRLAAVSDARAELQSLAADLPVAVAAQAAAVLDATEALPSSLVEERLAAAADHLVGSVEAGHRRTTRLRSELESTQCLAERDQLTGLHNRHFLERYLGDDDRPADLLTLLIDVDDLKPLNDTYGHAAGDAVLTAVGNVLRAHSRSGDVIVRWGGDEFLMLVPEVEGAGGLAFAERLAAAVRITRPAAPWAHLSVSVSIGVCTTRRTPLPLERLDAALYEVKRTGKGHAGLAPHTAVYVV